MNRAFKKQFHNGAIDEKAIVTLSMAVNNGKRFRLLDETSRKNLVDTIDDFMSDLNQFREEIKAGYYQNKKIT